MPILLTVFLPLLAIAQHKGGNLVAHGEHEKTAKLVLRLITQKMELIQTKSLDQCEVIGKEIMKGGKLSKFLKGYKCVPSLLVANHLKITTSPRNNVLAKH